MSITEKVVDSDKIWACLITNDSYLRGLLTLVFSLRKAKSKYPLVALYTESLLDKTLHSLEARDIPTQRVPYLYPGPQSEGEANAKGERATNGGSNGHTEGNEVNNGNTWYANDPRFRVCFTKLAVFSLTAYDRVVMLDADMLVRRNMDELFDVPLDEENRLFAATHACTCNPHHLRHYPPTWTPSNCAYTTQQHQQQQTPPNPSSNSTLNAGLLVLHPSPRTFTTITTFLHPTQPTPRQLPFADQSLLSTLFAGRWAALPYVYNALAPMRRSVRRGGHGGGGGHGDGGDGGGGGHGGHGGEGGRGLWRDEEVKAVHYILVPKPWEEDGSSEGEGGEEKEKGGLSEGRGAAKGVEDDKHGEGEGDDEDEAETRRWWREVDAERRRWEGERGIEC